MSTRFYYGQLDYIDQLNAMDDAITSVVGHGAILRSGGADGVMDNGAQLMVDDGTAAAPGLGVGSLVSGLYASGFEVHTTINGANKFRVTSTGARVLGDLAVDGNITGTFTGTFSGNAATATKLQTARTIALGGDATGSTSFDGSANVTITTTVVKLSTPRTIQISGDTTGSASFDGSANINIATTIPNSASALKTREGASTALFSGGQISINTSTTVNITAVSCVFMDYTNRLEPVASVGNFGPFNAVAVTNIATTPITYIGVNSSGTLVQQSSPFTATQRRTIVQLGAAVHSNNTSINAVNQLTAPGGQLLNQVQDFINAIGPLNLTGNAITANGVNLNINKSAGTIFKYGSNYPTSATDPHQLSLSAGTAITFRYRTQNSVETADTTSIAPTQYDNAGTLTAVGTNNFSIQRIYIFQSGLVRLQYGQSVYSSMANALAGIASESFVVESNIAGNGIALAYLVVKGNATDLTDPTQAKFVQLSKFGASSVSASTSLTAGDLIAILGYTPANAASPTLTGTTTLENMTFNGASRRILGDFTNATLASQTLVQTSTTNGVTNLGLIPNGTNQQSQISAYNNSTPTNSSSVRMGINAGGAYLVSDKHGTGSYLAMQFLTGGLERFRLHETTNRFQADFSNATISNRLFFQSSITDGTTVVGALPNGNALSSSFAAYNGTDPSNAALTSITISNTGATLFSGKNGTGTPLPLLININGTNRITFPVADNRIQGNFSTGAASALLMFQDSTVGNLTSVGALPNTSSGLAQFAAYNSNAPDNAGSIRITIDASLAYIMSDRTGSGSYLPMTFRTGGIDRMRLDTGGNLLFGTVDSNDPIAVRINGIRFDQANKAFNVRSTGTSEFGVSGSSGNHLTFFTDNGSTFVQAGVISSSGNTTTYGTGSDYRLKYNVEPMVNALESVKQIQFKTWRWKSNDLNGEGALAHELQDINNPINDAVIGEKDAVKEDENGTPILQQVDYSKLVPRIGCAVQELSAMLDAALVRITALENPNGG